MMNMEQNEINAQNTLSGVQPSIGVNAETTPVVPTESVAPVIADESLKTSKKKNPGMLIALILCVLLACGGVGFGIWAMIDGNMRVNQLNEQIISLQSQNANLTEENSTLSAEIESLSENEDSYIVLSWASTIVRDGIFYVLDANGEAIAQSSFDGPTVNEVVACETSAENTILKCTVNTSEGEGSFLYDAYSGLLTSSFDKE